MRTEGAAESRLSRGDAALALVLAVGCALLFRATAQARFANDGPVLATLFVTEPEAVHWQVLYLPAARALAKVVVWGDVFEPLRVLNALGAGIGVAASFLLARGLGVAGRQALAAAVLLAVSPCVWFFGTSVEVHALHFGMVGACACGTLFAPWRRPMLAGAVSALLLALTYLTHGTAPLMGLGWVLLAACGRARVAAPFLPRTLFLVVGPAFLGVLMLVVWSVKSWWSAAFDEPPTLELDLIRGYAEHTSSAAFLWTGLLKPLALLAPVVVVGLVVLGRSRAARDRRVAIACAAAIAPPLVFLTWWGVPERGGYLLGLAPFLAVLATAAFGRPSRGSLFVVAGLVLLQAAVAWTGKRGFDASFDPADRVELVHEHLADGGVLGTIGYLAPDISIWLPEVEEVDLVRRNPDDELDSIQEGWEADVPAADLARSMKAIIEQARSRGAVALDVSYRDGEWSLAGEEFLEYVIAFEQALLSHYTTRIVRRGSWTLILME
ncbi:MAG: hypothetical protein O7B99_04655 [Planctomycetota bacterium]|nr:hypothetical protein [Planctomycetota bacterium]